ncbi:MAG TPA: Ser-Thr-rich GPI-anchored membrane family protein [Blastocatellia bacterium]|nr:Ser-Thr-rich GPI-anchored membrane family protein [Blastocatellia bacterium]
MAPSFRAKADDFKAQTIQTIDLGATSASLQLLGASASDHLSGNGTADTFSTFPRAHALATGDFNNDGFRDIVVGAPDTDFTPTGGSLRQNAGAVYILFGRANFASPTIIDTNLTSLSQPDVKIFGAAADDNFGFAVAAGDVNGDNIDDLVVGAPGFDLSLTGPPPVSRQNAGEVLIFFGATTFNARTIDLATPNSANVQIVGEAAGDLFGSALAIGDVQGGTSGPDLLVGAPASKGPDPTGAARANGGAAYLLPGGQGLANAGTTTRVIDLGAAPAPVRVFGKTGSRLGSSVAIGDINAGNAADLIIGAPTANKPVQAGETAETGAVFVVFGGTNLTPTAPATAKTFDINATQQNISIYGEDANDHLGASIATANVNNDGTIDLIIGAPDAAGPFNSRPLAGEAYIVAGGTGLNPGTGATERRIDVTLGAVNLIIYGAAAGDRLGSTVAAGAINTQANTDTIADVILGAPAALSNKGTVSVLYGGAGLFAFTARDLAIGQDELRVIGQANGDELGWALATGDVDKNTGGDLIMGAPFADVNLGGGAVRSDAGKVYALLAAVENIPPQNQNPVVTVTAPNGGETIQGGSNFEITWTATDPNGDNTIQSFEIRLSTDGGANFNTIIASNVSGTARTFTWSVPTGVNTTTARVRVIAFDNAGGQGQDDSNANFTITDVGVVVLLLAPNGGENLRQGQVFKIMWTVGTGFENQVKGFDLFYTTDNGVTFTQITPINPNGPALGPAVRDFDWTVPNICTNTAKVVVRATSITNAISTDSSNQPFSISEIGPQIDPANMFFNGDFTKLNLRIVSDSQPRFAQGVRMEISTDPAGTQFIEVSKVKVKSSGKKIQARGSINGQTIGQFFPDGAHRLIRITNPTCGITILRVRRSGDQLVPDTAGAADAQGLSNWQ